MVLDLGPGDLAVMIDDLGRTIQRVPRTATGTDELGSPTYTLGAAEDVDAIVQAVRQDDNRVLAGILAVGDKQLYVDGDQDANVTDEWIIDGDRYRVVEEATPTVHDTPTRPYKALFVREVAGEEGA